MADAQLYVNNLVSALEQTNEDDRQTCTACYDSYARYVIIFSLRQVVIFLTSSVNMPNTSVNVPRTDTHVASCGVLNTQSIEIGTPAGLGVWTYGTIAHVRTAV